MYRLISNQQTSKRQLYWLLIILFPTIVVLFTQYVTTLPAQATQKIDARLELLHKPAMFNCVTCHTSEIGPVSNVCLQGPQADNCELNLYGSDLQKEFGNKPRPIQSDTDIDSALDAIKDEDSDGDGWTNEQELDGEGNKLPGTGEAKPDISVSITANPSAAVVDGEVNYHVLITNISAHTTVAPELTIDSITDSFGSQCKLKGTSSIAKGASTDFDCTIIVTDTYIVDNKLINAFNVTFRPPSKFQKTKTETKILGVAEVAKRLDLVVTPNLTKVVDGEPLIYQITVTNKTSIGSSTDTALGIVTNLEIVKDGTPCQETIKPVAELALNASTTFQCTVQVNQALDKKVTFQTKGQLKVNNSSLAITPTTPIEVEIEARNPDLSLQVSHSIERLPENDRVRLTFTLENSGNVPLSAVDIQIERIPSCVDPFDTIDAKATPPAYSCSVEIDSSLIEEIDGKPVYSFLITLSGTDKFDGKKREFLAKIIDIDISNRLYLPLINSSAANPTQNVDLIITSIIVNDLGASVTIKNIGNASLVGTGYWVDLYIHPSHVPTEVNQLARDFGDFGLVWGIPATAPSLPPNGELTLKSGNQFCSPELSEAPPILQSGWDIYAQVDSANKNTNYGGVLESHEIAGDAYNNIESIRLTDEISTQQWSICQPKQTSASSVKADSGIAERPR